MFGLNRKNIIDHPVSLIGDKEIPESFVKSLERWGYQITEEDLLRCIRDNRYKTAVYYAVVCLRSLGTKKCVPVLKSLTEYPKEDVQVCSVLAIGAISGSGETAYLSGLLESKFRNKFYVMATIWEVGDERAVDAVVEFAQKIIKKRISVRSQSDILYVTEYLERYTRSENTNSVAPLKNMLPTLQPW